MLTPKQWQQIGEWLKQSNDGVDLIAAERWRQISVEGWTSEHDDQHTEGQLADAAACYLRPHDEVLFDLYWPWSMDWWKPSPDDRIRELVKAGALIAAEIDRLKRKSG